MILLRARSFRCLLSVGTAVNLSVETVTPDDHFVVPFIWKLELSLQPSLPTKWGSVSTEGQFRRTVRLPTQMITAAAGSTALALRRHRCFSDLPRSRTKW
jgi:hypothetical protein